MKLLEGIKSDETKISNQNSRISWVKGKVEFLGWVAQISIKLTPINENFDSSIVTLWRGFLSILFGLLF